MSRASLFRSVLWRVVFGAAAGGLYGGLRSGAKATGALVGASLAVGFFALERLVLRRNAGGVIRPLPFLTYFALRSALYAATIVLAIGLVDFTVTGQFAGIGVDFLFSVALVIAVNLFFSVNDLLGPGTLFAFAAGRYYHPRIEERALLFVDLRSSTAIAERLGEVRFLSFLNRFVSDVSLAIAEAGGEIHKYVGDEVIATWRLALGNEAEAGCVGACFAALDRLKASGPAFESEFGQRADFRAGLHYGPVAVGELGSLKKEIALIGDTMNTAARILEACRATDNRVLASASLLDRLAALPAGVTRRRLGALPMRGKERALELYVLEAGAADALKPRHGATSSATHERT
jgi:adenylate cyclase